MNNYYKYLIVASVSISVFYLAYLLFFRKEQNFKLLRIFLLSSILFSLILPFNPVSINFTVKIMGKPLVESKRPIDNHTKQIDQNQETAKEQSIVQNIKIPEKIAVIDYIAILLKIYFFISAIIFARLILSMTKILYFYFSCEKIKNQKHTIILLDKRIIAFTFLNWIFVDKQTSGSDLAQIIKHEKIHASQYHSIDLLLSELLVATMWFNPFAWMFKNALQQVHEFLADEGVINSGFDKLEYQILLVNQAAEERLVAVSSNFSYSLIKKRIMMMSETKKSGGTGIKLLLMVSIVALLFTAISCMNSQNSDYVAAVSPTKMNLLYIGVDNPVSIAVTGAKQGKISAEIDKGTLSGENGNYTVKVKEPGMATITVKVDNSVIFKQQFRIKRVPDPIAVVKGKWDTHEFTNQELIDAGGIDALMTNFDFDLKFEVIDFTLSAPIGAGFLENVKTSGNTFSKQQIALIEKVVSGGKIYIDDIHVKGPDGILRNLGPLTVKIK